MTHDIEIEKDTNGYERYKCTCGITGAVWFHPNLKGEAMLAGIKHVGQWS